MEEASSTNHSNESTPLIEISNGHSNSINTDFSDDQHPETSLDGSSFNFYHEVITLLHIALPTVAVQFCTLFIYPQCASAVGRHLDTESLAAFSLGSLSGNMTCISIIIGTLTASETLQPRAFGLKQYREVGLLAIRGFFVCLVSLLLPVILFLTRADSIYNALGQNAAASQLASQWVQVYIFSVPPLLLFRVIQRYLACQNIVMPCVFGAAIGSLLVHPFILKWAVNHYGLIGSAWAVVATQLVQVVLCIGFVVRTGSYEKATWPGLDMPLIWEAMQVRQLISYAKLSIGGIFALSEW